MCNVLFILPFWIFGFYNQHLELVAVIPFFCLISWGREKYCNLPKVTQPVSDTSSICSPALSVSKAIKPSCLSSGPEHLKPKGWSFVSSFHKAFYLYSIIFEHKFHSLGTYLILTANDTTFISIESKK